MYEDLTPENTIQLLENLKNGTDKKGPQINRNDCEGPQGRTTLIVIRILCRELTLERKLDIKEISLKLSQIGRKESVKKHKRKSVKQNKPKELKKKDVKKK